MVYLIFALLVLAGVAYLYFGGSAGLLSSKEYLGKERATAEEQELLNLEDLIFSTKLALRDLDLENNIGKIAATDFEDLKQELLLEWSAAEERVAVLQKNRPKEIVTEKQAGSRETGSGSKSDLAAAFCPKCGSQTVDRLVARFCAACGTPLPLLKFFLLALTCFITGFQGLALSAYEIQVNVKNGTTGSFAPNGSKVSVIKLHQGMIPLETKQTNSGKVIFTDAPDPKSEPLMIQSVYKGVSYTKVVPLNISSPAQVELEIFDITRTYSAKIRSRTLLEVDYRESGKLNCTLILYFMNDDKFAFTEEETGIYARLPSDAVIESSSVSVGNSMADIQWLRLNPKKSEKSPELFLLPYPLKPGERVYQTQFTVPYDGQKANLALYNLYPQDSPYRILVEPDSVLVKEGETELVRQEDSQLQKRAIALHSTVSLRTITLMGGTPTPARDVPQKSNQPQDTEVNISSPLSTAEKIILPGVALLVFTLLLIYSRLFARRP